MPHTCLIVRAQNIITDERCREILRRYEAGEVSETQTRAQLAAELTASGVSLEVAREGRTRYNGLTSGPQLRNDVAHEFNELIFNKITEEGPNAFFNLKIATESSVTGWARQTLRSARSTVLRTLRNETTAHHVLVSPIPTSVSREEGTGSGAPALDQCEQRNLKRAPASTGTSTLAHRMIFEETADWLRSKASSQRGAVRTAACAEALRFAFDLPAAIRPDLATRVRLLDLLEADETAAHRSVRAMSALLAGGLPPSVAVDPDLMSLWDDYTSEQLQELSHQPPSVAFGIAMGGVSDRPRPNRVQMRQFRSRVRALGPMLRKGRKMPGWNTCAESVCRAFVAEEFETFSPLDTSGASTHEEKIAGRALALATASADYQRAVDFTGSPLGTTHDEVRERLEQIIGEVMGGGEVVEIAA